MSKLLSIWNKLYLDDELKKFANECEIESICVNKNRDIITMTAKNMINDNATYTVEICRQIKKQLFSDLDIKIRLIYEKPSGISNNKKDVKDENVVSKHKPLHGQGERIVRNKLSKDASNGLIYGKAFDDKPILISNIEGPCNNICISGQVIAVDIREYNNGQKIIYSMNITDNSDTIKAKLFLDKSDRQEWESRLKSAQNYIILKGNVSYDSFEKGTNISAVMGIKKCDKNSIKFSDSRVDTANIKRVELHCHTKMSDMDGMIDVRDLIKKLHGWGHKAVAITDHGVVQAYTDAMNVAKGYEDFKVIYGMEAYLVDDLKKVVENATDLDLNSDYVVFDIETTGLNATNDNIIEIGAVKIQNNILVDRFQSFVNPKSAIPFEIKKLTGIDDKDVRKAPPIEEVLPNFLEFAKKSIIVAHNASFDMSFILEVCHRQNINFNPTVIDTVALARKTLPSIKNYKLDTVAKHLSIQLLNHHRADQDAECTGEILIKLLDIARDMGADKISDLNIISNINDKSVKNIHPTHCIILVKNEIGRVNLYRLVSLSHLKYFYKKPRIPKSELIKYRDGLIIGSACSQGELYNAILLGKNDETLKSIAEFYDYLEIQPLCNNEYLMRGNRARVKSIDDLIEINKKIVRLGEETGKLVVATTDAHFLDPEDEIYRHMLLHGQKYKDFDEKLPIYIRTTDEMLKEFEYLGKEKAYEVVVTNTNSIANKIEKISPVRPDKCPPVIDGSEDMLRDICYKRAREIYGEILPSTVKDRLEKELTSIIGNGYAVMYIVARKLVKKSNDDGYLVGSRGSVGSSLVATMSGITEVNPLPPHYYCPNCHYSDFDSELVKSYARGAGCDMPNMKCPKCSADLKKDGFDIPFETFLGFKGDKEPDIDLNFSGEYQAIAHKYTEEIFGVGNTFKAGTVGTMAQKTACGYVKGYFEAKDIEKRQCEIERIAKKLEGIRRTTGQHPGGIVVLPKGEDIMSFTPIQHPANDMKSDVITTHFDYHSIDHNLLKLDILGHDDPSMIRKLEDLTGYEATNISLGDKSVLSLFNSTEALNIKPKDIGGCPLGVLGIPEFGTDFVIQMLLDTKPQSFSDLVRISGLSHGTNVWTDNAQILIKQGIADLSGAICTRDDIMLYLIEKNLEPSNAFKIMEQVRKGKGLKAEQEQDMIEHDVPQWYITSCKKISYMFPKAHAAAYVMMAYRIAYYKIYYPLAYYAAYYSVRADNFDYSMMSFGIDILDDFIKKYEIKERPTSIEKDILKQMNIVREMYARGIEFEPIDIYKAYAYQFKIVNNKIMPALNSISGLGETIAKSIEREAKIKKFNSIEDFKNRTKADQTTTEKLIEMGILQGLPQSNQLSLFDFV